jgi:hypothetical protein
MKKKVSLSILTFWFALITFAQTDSLKTSVSQNLQEDRPLKFSLNKDGSRYFQVTFLNQTWVRFNESNPGSTVFGDRENHTFDIGLRRTRIQMYGQITDRAFVYFQFGMNNFNRNYQMDNNRKIQSFFHDALGEYRLTKGNELKLGGGLTIANGLSRFSNPSVGTIMTLDLPVFAQATVDQTDLFSRKLSVYARGQLGKLDYRVVLSDPFSINSAGTAIATNANGAVQVITKNKPNDKDATFANVGHSYQYQGYFSYNFWEKESHLTPYMTGTYLGKKKVLNIGAGAIYQPKAMWRLNEDSLTTYDDLFLWSVEGYLDTYLNKDKNDAISFYLGYFNYNFGKNYLRYNGIMNPANGLTDGTYAPSASFGNAVPMMGTGQVIYTQLGYLLPHQAGKPGIMPFISYTRSDFDKLKDPVNLYDIGVNLLMNGHKSKLSFDYQNRPAYNADFKVGQRKSCFILQYQLFI